MIVQVKVDIPDGWELACDEMRPALKGEIYLVQGRQRGFVVVEAGNGTTGPTIIVRPAWQWPEWLLAGWIAMDEDGCWFAYSREPKVMEEVWYCDDEETWLGKSLFAFAPPPCTDWRQSKRRNPRAK